MTTLKKVFSFVLSIVFVLSISLLNFGCTRQTQHYYVWKTDVKPTVASEGLKHLECYYCGDVKNKNTPIAKRESVTFVDLSQLLPQEYFTASKRFFSGYYNEYFFSPNQESIIHNCSELKEFLNAKIISDSGFYCVDVDSLVCEMGTQLPYFLNYVVDESAPTPFISISCAIKGVGYYGDYDGDYPIGSSPEGFLTWSFKMLLVSVPFEYSGEEFTYKKYRCGDESDEWNNVLCVYNGEQIVCQINYWTLIDVSLDYFVKLFKEQGFLLKGKTLE